MVTRRLTSRLAFPALTVAIVAAVGAGLYVALRPSELSQPAYVPSPAYQDLLSKVDLAPIQPLLNTNIPRAAALIAKEIFPSANPDRLEVKVKEIAQDVRRSYPEVDRADPDTVIAILNAYFFKDRRLHYDFAYSPSSEACFLHHVAEKSSGNCVSMPLLYLAVGEQMGLPFRLVETPHHYFARWEDDRYRGNVECTSGGGEVLDEGYIQKENIPPLAVQSGVYMRSLCGKEVVAALLTARAQFYASRGDFKNAARDYRWGLALNPRCGNAVHNMAEISLEMRDYGGAQVFTEEIARFGIPYDMRAFEEKLQACQKRPMQLQAGTKLTEQEMMLILDKMQEQDRKEYLRRQEERKRQDRASSQPGGR